MSFSNLLGITGTCPIFVFLVGTPEGGACQPFRLIRARPLQLQAPGILNCRRAVRFVGIFLLFTVPGASQLQL